MCTIYALENLLGCVCMSVISLESQALLHGKCEGRESRGGCIIDLVLGSGAWLEATPVSPHHMYEVCST